MKITNYILLLLFSLQLNNNAYSGNPIKPSEIFKDSLIGIEKLKPEHFMNPSEHTIPLSLTFYEIFLSLIVIITCLLVLLIGYIIIRRVNFDEVYSFKLIVIILVIFSSLFLVTAGYSQQQIAPVIGLLGTIIGFIFGNSLNKNSNEVKPNDSNNDIDNNKKTI